MDRHVRYNRLRALWARARTLLAWLHGPRQHEARLRAQRWQQIQVAERQIADGVVRGIGDPDAYVRPQDQSRGREASRAWQARDEAHWEPQREAQRRWHEAQHRQHQGRR